MSSQKRVRARAGPVTVSFGEETEANLPTIGPYVEAEVLLACNFCYGSQVFADAKLRINPMVARYISRSL